MSTRAWMKIEEGLVWSLTRFDEIGAEDLQKHVWSGGQLQQEGDSGHLHHLTVWLHALLNRTQNPVVTLCSFINQCMVHWKNNASTNIHFGPRSDTDNASERHLNLNYYLKSLSPLTLDQLKIVSQDRERWAFFAHLKQLHESSPYILSVFRCQMTKNVNHWIHFRNFFISSHFHIRSFVPMLTKVFKATHQYSSYYSIWKTGPENSFLSNEMF